MMYGNVPSDYMLAEKMKSRFRGRGAAISGMQASPTSELMKRAQMGKDPSVNCSELAFHDSMSARRQTFAQSGARQENVYQQNPRSRSALGSSHTQNRKTPERQGIQYGQRNAADGRSNSGSGSASVRQKAAGAAANQKKKAPREKQIPKQAQVRYAAEEITEVKAVGRRVTPMFVVFLVIGTMMIMSIVLSFSEIYRTTSEISQLENDLAALRDRAADLELELEEKNDIRVIEQIATDELGMVKEDVVQRWYLSLSDGERIDIIDENEEADGSTASGVSGVLLSSIWPSLDSLFDYFR